MRAELIRVGAVLLGVLLVGCDESSLGDLPLRVVKGVPAIAPGAPPGVSIETTEDIQALGARGSRLVVGTSTTVYGLGEVLGTLEESSIYSDDPAAPSTTGKVDAIGRRAANLLVVSDSGVFHTSGDKLLHSPASGQLGPLGISSIAADGPETDEHLWLATAKGLYELRGGVLSKWTVDGESGVPTVVSTGGSLVYVAFGDRLYELDAATGEVMRVPHSFGAIHAIAHGAEGSVYVAAKNGLFEREANGGYVQYTLSDTATPAAAHAVVFDPKKGMFAVTDAGIVLANPGDDLIGITAYPSTLSSSPTTALAVADDIGNVWMGAGTHLEGMRIGSTVTFDADVVPVLETYCGSCHVLGAQQSPLIELLDYETVLSMSSRIIQRVSAGQMPPPAGKPMPAEAFEIILRWEASGRNR